MDNMDDTVLEQPRLALRSPWPYEHANRVIEQLADPVTPRVRQQDQVELLQEALTHQALKALGATYWDVCGIEDARQVMSDRYGHRDGPNKQRRPPAELRLFHCVDWSEVAPNKRAALISLYLKYLDVDEERGPLIFGVRGWDAIATACDLIIAPPATQTALDSFVKRTSYSHPAIRKRVDNVRRAISGSV